MRLVLGITLLISNLAFADYHCTDADISVYGPQLCHKYGPDFPAKNRFVVHCYESLVKDGNLGGLYQTLEECADTQALKISMAKVKEAEARLYGKHR